MKFESVRSKNSTVWERISSKIENLTISLELSQNKPIRRHLANFHVNAAASVVKIEFPVKAFLVLSQDLSFSPSLFLRSLLTKWSKNLHSHSSSVHRGDFDANLSNLAFF